MPLIDATLKHAMPPLALPKEQYMTAARKIWEELELPVLMPQPPWHGYHLGDWDKRWDEYAEAATSGGVKPETPVFDASGGHSE